VANRQSNSVFKPLDVKQIFVKHRGSPQPPAEHLYSCPCLKSFVVNLTYGTANRQKISLITLALLHWERLTYDSLISEHIRDGYVIALIFQIGRFHRAERSASLDGRVEFRLGGEDSQKKL
jgi:hypothetical protein